MSDSERANGAPIATPAPSVSELVEGLPKWCRGMRYVAATNKIMLLVDLPIGGLLHGLAPLLGGGWVGPLPEGAFPVELACDPANARALIGVLQRGVDEADKIVIDAS